ncbi:MAG: SH3 domain-containing protein [Candidatus Limiplasma sp.]|nr:SH3 domain-containing protein [Candidatus Limiplasma sp.]
MHMLGWYMSRYRTERRKYRKMMPEQRPITWLAALLMVLLMAAVGLWVLWPPPALAATYTITVDDYCHVREQPLKTSPSLGRATGGEQLEGIGYQDGWVQVEVSFEQSTGWIRADLLTLKDYHTGRYTNASGGRVHIRREPDGKHAAWLKAGGTVEVLRWVDADGVWAYTSEGYIDGTYLQAK